MGSEKKGRTRKKADKRLVISSVICFCVGIFTGVGAVKLPDWVKDQNNAAKQETEEMGYDAVEIVKLGEYKGIEVSLTPTEEDIQAEIDSLLEENTNYEQLKTTARDGDKVHATVTATVNGEQAESAELSDYVDLGSGMELPEIEDALIGMKSGQKKEVTVEVPEGHYGDSMIDGKKAEYQIKLDYVCGEPFLPDYNDEFVKEVTSYDSVKEYNAYLEKKLKEENEEDKAEYAWTLVLENSEVDDADYPKVLIEQQKKEILQGYYDFAEISGISRDEAFQQFGCEDEQDFIDTELDAAAKDGAKDILISEAIAVKENIYYTDKDYKSLLNREYEENQDMYKSKGDYEKKNKAYLQNTALIEVVKSFIDKNAKYV
ncbi:MAG: hypothetical protein IJ733_16610 [Lachnospiraceae bacterium]|nr:hypothetical protein [Lachnospiraceae bacterium]